MLTLTQSSIDEFVERIPFSGCWIWLGGITKDGYGRVSYAATERFVHRISYILFKGGIPEKLCVLHKCNIRSCINPEHLYAGTKADNSADRYNITATPEFDASTRLRIIELKAQGYSDSILAELYQCSRSRIWRIMRNYRKFRSEV